MEIADIAPLTGCNVITIAALVSNHHLSTRSL